MVRHHVHADFNGTDDASEHDRGVDRAFRVAAVFEGDEANGPGGSCSSSAKCSDACTGDSGTSSAKCGDACSSGADCANVEVETIGKTSGGRIWP